MSNEPVFVVALGASTPVGRDAWSSAAAVRAGIAGFSEHPSMIDTAGEPMHGALAPWLDIEMSATERFEALLLPAIAQVMDSRSAQLSSVKTALALGLPAARPGLPAKIVEHLRAALSTLYPEQFAALATFPDGHAAGFLALDAALRRLRQGTFDACVVAGVDSYFHPETLEWIESCDQLHGAGPLNNAWGFVPGEGAGAVLLKRESALDKDDVLLAELLSVGTALEPNAIKTETVCIGAGLTQAFRSTLEILAPGSKVNDVYCDLNGEVYRADEYGFTGLRNKDHFESVSNFMAPAECWGDVAAAGAPLHIMLAAIAGKKGYASGPLAFVCGSSEPGQRGAALLRVGAGVNHAG